MFRLLGKRSRMDELSVPKQDMNFLEINYSTLEKATECFNDSHKLGQGGFGEVFKVNTQMLTIT